MKTYLSGSLFDRLIDEEPFVNKATNSIKTLTEEELKHSIHRELTWLLNTTCSFSNEQMESLERNTITYGIQDFSCFFPDSSENRVKLARVIRDVITSFEPRLKNVDVEVKEMSNSKDRFSLSLIIDAELILNKVTEPITFIMAIE